MNRTSVIFKNPYEIELRRDTLPSPREGEVVIKTHMSAISAGTEMLVYRGQFPPSMTTSKHLPTNSNIRSNMDTRPLAMSSKQALELQKIG
jgi:hypothetical protein